MIGMKSSSIVVMFFSIFMFLGIPMQNLQAQDLKCFILTPPDQVLEGIQKIAIADFAVTSTYDEQTKPGGSKNIDKILNTIEKVSSDKARKDAPQPFPDAGKKLADLMISKLMEEDRGVRDVGSGFLGLKRKEGRFFQQGARTNVFIVVERERLDQVLKEMELGQTGLIDETQASEVGKLLGVDAIITGQVNAACKDSWSKETRTRKKNKVEEKYEVWCNSRVATASAVIRIVNVETGQLIGTREASNKQNLKKCEGDYGSDLPPADQTVELCLQSMAEELVNYFMPKFKQQKFEFAKVETKEFKRQAELAKKNIEAYDLNNAFVQFSAMLDQDPYNHAALYNLGMLHEVVGNYKQAVEKYNMAAQLVSKEDKYRKAVQRVAKQERFWEQLRALGVELNEYSFSATEEEKAAAVIPRIQIAGSGSDRVEVYEAPADDSRVMLKVPGGIELETVAEEGEWYKVKLLDGRQGYVSKEQAKQLK